MIDRRQGPRAISMFKSAYVRSEGRLHFVTLRNLSESGVCLDAYPGVSEGDEIEYCIDSGGPRAGVVKWVRDGRFGVGAEQTESAHTSLRPLPQRSVRLPLVFSAHLFLEGRQQEVTIHNLSISGACIDSPSGLEQGQLVSIKIANRVFELATIRWVHVGKAGVRFAEAVNRADFGKLVAQLQQPAERLARAPSHWPGSLADALETAA